MRVLFLIDKVQGVADMSGSHSVSSAGSSTGPRRRSGLKPGAVAAVLHRGDAALPAEVQLLAFEQVRGFLLLSWSADRFLFWGRFVLFLEVGMSVFQPVIVFVLAAVCRHCVLLRNGCVVLCCFTSLVHAQRDHLGCCEWKSVTASIWRQSCCRHTCQSLFRLGSCCVGSV